MLRLYATVLRTGYREREDGSTMLSLSLMMRGLWSGVSFWIAQKLGIVFDAEASRRLSETLLRRTRRVSVRDVPQFPEARE